MRYNGPIPWMEVITPREHRHSHPLKARVKSSRPGLEPYAFGLRAFLWLCE